MNKKDSINGFNGLEYQNAFGESDCSEHSLHHDLYVRIRDDINEKILLSVEQSINGAGNKSFESNVVISRQYIIDALNEKAQREQNEKLTPEQLVKMKGQTVYRLPKIASQALTITEADMLSPTHIVLELTDGKLSWLSDMEHWNYYLYDPTEVKR